jgi:hypothetical protein
MTVTLRSGSNHYSPWPFFCNLCFYDFSYVNLKTNKIRKIKRPATSLWHQQQLTLPHKWRKVKNVQSFWKFLIFKKLEILSSLFAAKYSQRLCHINPQLSWDTSPQYVLHILNYLALTHFPNDQFTNWRFNNRPRIAWNIRPKWIVFVMWTVYSILHGLDKMKRRVCSRAGGEKEINWNWPEMNYADHSGRGFEFGPENERSCPILSTIVVLLIAKIIHTSIWSFGRNEAQKQ